MKRAFRDISPLPQMTRGVAAHISGHGGQGQRTPKVSRRVVACTECQTRKIKCDLSVDGSECSRCRKKGLECIVNKSLQSLLEDQAEWKAKLEQESVQMRLAVSHILRTLNLPTLETFRPGEEHPADLPQGGTFRLDVHHGQSFSNSQHTSPNEEHQRLQQARMAMTRDNSHEPDSSNEGADDNLVAAPMGTLYEVTKLRNIRSNPRGRNHNSSITDDFISRGDISEEEANELFATFSLSLNHYLWAGIALVHSNLESVRRSSSLLLAAILTVTALHIPGRTRTFDICYAEFLDLVCNSMLDKYHTLDGVRGLCIGAFWLSDVSWKLSGHGVRIATELNLHQSYRRAIDGSKRHLEGARLWYLLYVCDHHFSIAYGRPPVIHEDAAIAGHERFLRMPGITQADMRLHSQVAMFIILTKIYHTFGPDLEQVVGDHDLMLLLRYDIDLDNWRSTWEPQLAPNDFIASYPAKGVILHYNFAKLQLNSLALRGFRHLNIQSASPERVRCANTAVSCAITVLHLVTREQDIKAAIVGVPLYMHTMITYAAVFLLKIQLAWEDLLLEARGVCVRDLVAQVIELLKAAKASDRHLCYHIAEGLGRMLDNSFRSGLEDQSGNQAMPQVRVNSTAVNVGQSSEGTFQAYNTRYPTGDEYSAFAPFNQPTDLFDENMLPFGFFDIMAISGDGRYGGPSN